MIPLIHQEKDWLALDKPAGLSVHNQEGETNLLQEISRQLNVSEVFPVHRLDKETSGVQILALNAVKAAELAREFQEKALRKIYEGVVAGSVQGSGVWTWPLTDRGEGRQNPAGPKKDQKPCETRYRLLQSAKYFSRLEFEILTGRQHQIRKHCLLAGRALIGDSRYGNPGYNQKIGKIYRFHRMALHCREIKLQSGLTLQAPTPVEFDFLFQTENQ